MWNKHFLKQIYRQALYESVLKWGEGAEKHFWLLILVNRFFSGVLVINMMHAKMHIQKKKKKKKKKHSEKAYFVFLLTREGSYLVTRLSPTSTGMFHKVNNWKITFHRQ